MGKTTLVFRFEKTDTVREVIEMDTDTDQIHGTYVTFYGSKWKLVLRFPELMYGNGVESSEDIHIGEQLCC